MNLFTPAEADDALRPVFMHATRLARFGRAPKDDQVENHRTLDFDSWCFLVGQLHPWLRGPTAFMEPVYRLGLSPQEAIAIDMAYSAIVNGPCDRKAWEVLVAEAGRFIAQGDNAWRACMYAIKRMAWLAGQARAGAMQPVASVVVPFGATVVGDAPRDGDHPV